MVEASSRHALSTNGCSTASIRCYCMPITQCPMQVPMVVCHLFGLILFRCELFPLLVTFLSSSACSTPSQLHSQWSAEWSTRLLCYGKGGLRLRSLYHSSYAPLSWCFINEDSALDMHFNYISAEIYRPPAGWMAADFHREECAWRSVFSSDRGICGACCRVVFVTVATAVVMISLFYDVSNFALVSMLPYGAHLVCFWHPCFPSSQSSLSSIAANTQHTTGDGNQLGRAVRAVASGCAFAWVVVFTSILSARIAKQPSSVALLHVSSFGMSLK